MHKARLTTALLDYINPFFQKNDKFNLPAVESALSLHLSTVLVVYPQRPQPILRTRQLLLDLSIVDLGFGCLRTWNNVLPILFINRFSVKFFAGLCFHQKLF